MAADGVASNKGPDRFEPLGFSTCMQNPRTLRRSRRPYGCNVVRLTLNPLHPFFTHLLLTDLLFTNPLSTDRPYVNNFEIIIQFTHDTAYNEKGLLRRTRGERAVVLAAAAIAAVEPQGLNHRLWK
jgi:hypothetical protein